MVNAVIQIRGVRVKGRLLISRKDLCDLMGIKSATLTNKLGLFPHLREAQIKGPLGEMWDVERVLGLQIKLNRQEDDSYPKSYDQAVGR